MQLQGTLRGPDYLPVTMQYVYTAENHFYVTGLRFSTFLVFIRRDDLYHKFFRRVGIL